MGTGLIIIGLLFVGVAGVLLYTVVSVMEEDKYRKEAFEKEQEEISKEVMEMMMGEATSFFEANGTLITSSSTIKTSLLSDPK